MKKILFALSFLLILSLSVGAQSFSHSVKFPQANTDCRLVRSFGMGDRAVEYISGVGSAAHQIIGAMPGSGRYMRYVLPAIANSFGGMSFTVNDMRAEGDVLFLCGSIVVPSSFNPGSVGNVVEGFVAEVRLDNMFDNANPNVQFRWQSVPGTVDLRKLAVRINHFDTTWFMIGRASDGHQAVVVLDYSLTNPIHVCHMGGLDETLTDIVVGEKVIAVASKFNLQNYSFGLRFANLTNVIYGNNFSEFEVVNKFVTNGMHTVGRNNHPTWHTHQATIRLAMKDDWDLTLAYEGYNVIPQDGPVGRADAKVLTLFRFDASDFANVTMTDARTMEIPYSYDEQFADMLSGPGFDEVVLLHSGNAALNAGGGVTVFSWSAANHRMLLRQELPVVSMDVKSSKLWLGGQESDGPWLGCQMLSGQEAPCFVEQFRPSARVFDLQPSLPILQEVDCFDFRNLWSSYSRIGPSVISKLVLCSH